MFLQDVEIDDLIPCDKYSKPLFAQLEGESASLAPGCRSWDPEVLAMGNVKCSFKLR